MKKTIFIATTLLALTGCASVKNPYQTASNPPAHITVPANLAQDENAVYFSKLLDSYISNPDLISTEPAKPMTEQQLKERKEQMFAQFEKSGLSRQQALEAFNKYVVAPQASKRNLVKLPKGADSGAVISNKGTTMLLFGKTTTTKDTKGINVAYKFNNQDDAMRKYFELAALFPQLLPADQHWVLQNEGTVSQMWAEIAAKQKAASDDLGKYDTDPSARFKEKSEQSRKKSEEALKNTHTLLRYGWPAAGGLDLYNVQIQPFSSIENNNTVYVVQVLLTAVMH